MAAFPSSRPRQPTVDMTIRMYVSLLIKLTVVLPLNYCMGTFLSPCWIISANLTIHNSPRFSGPQRRSERLLRTLALLYTLLHFLLCMSALAAMVRRYVVMSGVLTHAIEIQTSLTSIPPFDQTRDHCLKFQTHMSHHDHSLIYYRLSVSLHSPRVMTLILRHHTRSH